MLGTATANTALTEGDAPPSYSVSSNAASATEGAALTFTVNRTLAAGESVANSETVNWSANGQSGTVTFAAGDTSKTFTVATTDNHVWGTHSPNVTATISNPTDGAVLGTATAGTALTDRHSHGKHRPDGGRCAAHLFGERRHRVRDRGLRPHLHR